MFPPQISPNLLIISLLGLYLCQVFLPPLLTNTCALIYREPHQSQGLLSIRLFCVFLFAFLNALNFRNYILLSLSLSLFISHPQPKNADRSFISHSACHTFTVMGYRFFSRRTPTINICLRSRPFLAYCIGGELCGVFLHGNVCNDFSRPSFQSGLITVSSFAGTQSHAIPFQSIHGAPPPGRRPGPGLPEAPHRPAAGHPGAPTEADPRRDQASF